MLVGELGEQQLCKGILLQEGGKEPSKSCQRSCPFFLLLEHRDAPMRDNVCTHPASHALLPMLLQKASMICPLRFQREEALNELAPSGCCGALNVTRAVAVTRSRA